MFTYEDPELTAADYLVAELMELEQAMPGGYQVALAMRVTKAIERAEALFAKHDLPSREELIAELTLWRCHLEDGMAFVRRCEDIVGTVARRLR